jgi:hypothetical protein
MLDHACLVNAEFGHSIDTNSLKKYQQAFLYTFPMFTTPIFIHTCVVHVRLRWFEKRFESVGWSPLWLLVAIDTPDADELACSCDVSPTFQS